jgi:serine/threonine protein kinase
MGKRIQIIYGIVYAVSMIHEENAIHRDLHSGNILFNSTDIRISDLGFCGPADKPLDSIYGNLPYIAPEVISGKETTFASDIYSIGMLMWEISFGQPPFTNFENDYELALKIINGMRPKIVPGTPLEYKELMVQCWDADPTKRPDADTLCDKISEINRLNYQNESNENKINDTISFETNNTSTSGRLFTSKVYQFKNFPEPKNATEGQYHNILVFHEIMYIYSI